ncbi:metallophosphoesterase [bacterium]|nr:metallophosphoesterase [bacterium]
MILQDLTPYFMRKVYLLILVVILSLVFLNTSLTVYATIYRIIDAEGNTIRVTTEPQIKKAEEEAGCILSPIQLAVVPLISQDISKVKGIVFEDHNSNGIQDIEEMGLPDILVSNGLTVTVTDETGSYLLPREGHFVFITTPSNYIYTTPWYKNLLEDNLHFGLRFAPDKDSKQFTFVQITDIHTDTIEEHRVFIEKAVDEINRIGPDFIVVTGDLVWKADETKISQAEEWFDIYSSLISNLDMPVFNTVGNHDVVSVNYKKGISTEPGYNKGMYRDYFGPTYYSFDWASYHCIVLDPNELLDGNQVYKIPDYQIEWLREDLSYRQGSPLLIFFHIPTRSWENYAEVLNLFNQHSTKMFSGHLHMDVLIDSQGIPEQVTGALCGEWWRGFCPDGKPYGYRIVQVEGSNISSFYKEIGSKRQINIIAPDPLVCGITEVTAQIYTQYGPLEEVRYQIDQGDIKPMKIVKGKIWDTVTAIGECDTTRVTAGYHIVMVEARDKEGVFSQQMEVKVNQSEIVPLGEIIPYFKAYQGHLIKVKVKTKTSFIEESSYSLEESTFINSILIVKDETGAGVILIGDYNAQYLPDLDRGKIITAKVIPVKYLWKTIDTKYKILIALYTFKLPKGFVIRSKLKPKGVHLLWLIDCESEEIN